MRLPAFFLLACAFPALSAPRFESAVVCYTCHSNLTADARNVAPYTLWLGTMMANSARDPYWKAKVRQETVLNPNAVAVIEDKCLRCHAPAQQYAFRERNQHMPLAELNATGEQGVTCTVCHQITAEGLGRKSNFTGNFVLSRDNKIFGPHKDPFSMPMQHHTEYEPAYSKHVLESAFCATCHTVITPTLTAEGKVAGEFLEQAPYLEWLVSDYAREGKTCQSCHMPQLGSPAYIAHRPPGGPFPPTSPRTPFGLHYLVGANVRGPEMLTELFPERGPDYAATSARAESMLSRALELKLSASRANPRELSVEVRNLTGHKLPTAFPSRRLWLHVTALDSNGRTLFESGAIDAATSEIRGLKVSPDHLQRVTSPDQVIIYEAELADAAGNPTNSLLRAASYRKDNRILPHGFDLKRKLPDGLNTALLAPAGTAADKDFVPGSDRVSYLLPQDSATVVVEALYQSIKPSHATNSKNFADLYRRHSQPVIAATAKMQLTQTR